MQVTADVGEDVEKRENYTLSDGNTLWYNHSGNQSAGSSEYRT